MELSALYERPVARNLGLSLYLAPVGEPAVGPVAFPDRPSAADDPLAPIAHRWQDGTHITFGVVTAGERPQTVGSQRDRLHVPAPAAKRSHVQAPAPPPHRHGPRHRLDPESPPT